MIVNPAKKITTNRSAYGIATSAINAMNSAPSA